MPFPDYTSLPFPAEEAFNGGFFDYNDLATSSSPISVAGGGGFVKLTNDQQGAFTNKEYKPSGISDLWNSTSNQFDWSQLSLGDMIDIRLDLEVTSTTPNQEIDVELFLGVGPSEYAIPFFRGQFKNAGAVDVNRFNGIYMGDLLTRDLPGEFRVSSDANATVIVRGWYLKVIKRG